MTLIKYTLFGIGMALFVACGNGKQSGNVEASAPVADSTVQAAARLGKITFEEPAYDFGQVTEGEKVTHTFVLKNTGDAPVILSRVSASCGCTQPEFSKSPVLPGKTSDINVTFNSEGQVGKQQKIITIQSNAENGLTTVQLKGEVLAK